MFVLLYHCIKHNHRTGTYSKQAILPPHFGREIQPKTPFSTTKVVKYDIRRLGQRMVVCEGSIVSVNTRSTIGLLVEPSKDPFLVLVLLLVPSKRWFFDTIITNCEWRLRMSETDKTST